MYRKSCPRCIELGWIQLSVHGVHNMQLSYHSPPFLQFSFFFFSIFFISIFFCSAKSRVQKSGEQNMNNPLCFHPHSQTQLLLTSGLGRFWPSHDLYQSSHTNLWKWHFLVFHFMKSSKQTQLWAGYALKNYNLYTLFQLIVITNIYLSFCGHI